MRQSLDVGVLLVIGIGRLGRRLPGGFLRQEDRVDVGQNSSLGDGDSSKQWVELLIVPDGELEVTGNDPLLLVVPGSVPSQLEDLSSEVLHHSSQVDGSSTSNPLGVVSLPQVAVDPSHGELKSSSDGPGLRLGPDSRHLASRFLHRRFWHDG